MNSIETLLVALPAEYDGNNIVRGELEDPPLSREMKLRENSIARRPLISGQLSRRESADGVRDPMGISSRAGFNQGGKRSEEFRIFFYRDYLQGRPRPL